MHPRNHHSATAHMHIRTSDTPTMQVGYIRGGGQMESDQAHRSVMHLVAAPTLPVQNTHPSICIA
jgi:hypothetical protein